MKIFLSLLLVVIATVSCNTLYHAENNPYYYTYNKYKIDNLKLKNTERINTFKLDENSLKYFSDLGYIIIGYNNFHAPANPYYNAEANAKLKGANILLFSQEYLGTNKGNYTVAMLNKGQEYQINQQINTTSKLNGSSSSIGISNNGYGFVSSNLYGNVQSTSNITTTIKEPDFYTYHNIPYSTDIYKHKVVYLIHPFRLKIKNDKKYLTDLIGGYSVNKVEKIQMINNEWRLVKTEYVDGEIYLGYREIFFRKSINDNWKYRDLNYKKTKSSKGLKAYIFESEKYGETRIAENFQIVSFYDDNKTKYYYYIDKFKPSLIK